MAPRPDRASAAPCMLAAALGAIAGCAAPSTVGPRQGEEVSLWKSVERDQADEWRDRDAVLSGYTVARAPRSVVLLRKPPEKDEDGLPSYDTDRCIALMVSPEQYRLLQRKGLVRVSGKFLTVNTRRPDSVVTHIEREHRIISISCVTPRGIVPFIFVERLDF
jgi:hypothetical protein